MVTHKKVYDRRGGFSLVEMLTVLVILAIVIAIVVPALGAARTAARRTATQAMLASLNTAILQFQIDQRRAPGYFSAKDMGGTANRDIGFTALDNMMLDLLGGGIVKTTGPDIITVGPSSTSTVNVDLTRFGAGTQTTKGYFKPDGKMFLTSPLGRSSTDTTNMPRLPALVDSFGQPVLAWVQDDSPAVQSFAAVDSGTRARFYWNSNAGFLKSTALGKLAQSQPDTNNTPPVSGSLLASTTDANLSLSLAGFLGNPASFDSSDPSKPTAARGSVVLHSAGANGVYLGREERGGKVAAGTGGVIQFVGNQDPITGGAFDDIIVTGSGGN